MITRVMEHSTRWPQLELPLQRLRRYVAELKGGAIMALLKHSVEDYQPAAQLNDPLATAECRGVSSVRLTESN